MSNFDKTIELVTCESGDWEKLYIDGVFFDCGHSTDWVAVIKFLGYDLKVTEISDEEMEDNPFG